MFWFTCSFIQTSRTLMSKSITHLSYHLLKWIRHWTYGPLSFDQTNEFLPHATTPVKITVTFDSVSECSEARSGGHDSSGGSCLRSFFYDKCCFWHERESLQARPRSGRSARRQGRRFMVAWLQLRAKTIFFVGISVIRRIKVPK